MVKIIVIIVKFINDFGIIVIDYFTPNLHLIIAITDGMLVNYYVITIRYKFIIDFRFINVDLMNC